MLFIQAVYERLYHEFMSVCLFWKLTYNLGVSVYSLRYFKNGERHVMTIRSITL